MKKAVSPLIAWVLLIGFTVGVGILVSNFVIKQTERFKPGELVEGSLFCDSVAFSVDSYCRGELPNNPSGWGKLTLSLKNRGSFTINKIVYNLNDARGVISDSIQLTLQPGGSEEISLAVKDNNIVNGITNNMEIKKLILTPVITEEEKEVSCSEKKFIMTEDMFDEVQPCGGAS
ncbi:MAG: hypothetical protein AB1571_01870 [Nanoarchaeota archaeon]